MSKSLRKKRNPPSKRIKRVVSALVRRKPKEPGQPVYWVEASKEGKTLFSGAHPSESKANAIFQIAATNATMRTSLHMGSIYDYMKRSGKTI